MKKCCKCCQMKPLSDFGVHKIRADGLRGECKDCGRMAARDFYRRNPDPYKRRAKIFHTKKGNERIAESHKIKEESGCIACGEKTPCVLDFHHLEGNSKGKEGGMPVTRAAWQSDKKFRQELSKCIVLCANCHRKAHAGLLKLRRT